VIQDAHPMRSGVPDCYVALYKIDVVVAASTWTVNSDRFPSGFGAGSNVFGSTGVANIVFPPGMKVRGAQAQVSPPTAAAASYRTANVCNINEAAGTAQIMITDGGLLGASPALANPLINSIIWAELDLETV
jgi:hypothetical protein